MRGLPEVYRPWVALARKLGWTVDIAGSGHVRWTAPDGSKMFTPCTSVSRRGFLNARAELRRRGLPI